MAANEALSVLGGSGEKREVAENEVRAVLARYDQLVARAAVEESGTPDGDGRSVWPGAEQALLEEVEALLRRRRQQMLHRVAREGEDGFFLDTTERVWIAYQDLVGEIAAIFGMRGSGKSHTVALLAEKLVLRGIPLTIIDPHGEYYSLRALPRPLLVIGIPGGTASHADLLVEPDQATAIAEFSVHEGVSIVLDVSGLKEAVRYEVLAGYFEGLWTACAREKRPYHLFLEEAHTFIPERGSSPVEAIVSHLATEYRKYGVGMVVVDQRPANVKKTPITQARVRILHEVDDPLDIDRYKQYVPKRYGKRLEDLLASFEAGTALVKIRKEVDIIQVQPRATVHVGVTPSLDGATTIIDIASNDQLAQRLAAVLDQLPRRERRRGGSGEGNTLHDLQARLRDVEAENLVLREQLTLLGVLRVTTGDDQKAWRARTEPPQMPVKHEGEDAPLEAERAQGGASSLVSREEAARASSALQDHLETLQRQMRQLEEENERLQAEVVRLSASAAEAPARADQGITNVHFEQASIGTFCAGTGVALPASAPSDGVGTVTGVQELPCEAVQQRGGQETAVVVQELPVTGEALLATMPYSARQSFTRLCVRVKALSSSEKAVLRWLLDHDEHVFSALQLADAVTIDIHALWSGRTEQLARLAFVKRWKQQNKLWYCAEWASYSQRVFPTVSCQALKELLFAESLS